MVTGSYPFRRRRVTVVAVVSLVLSLMATPAMALTEPPMSEQPMLITLTDEDIGADAFDRLVEYGNGGHADLGAIVAEAHGYFGGGETVGVGLGIGSGGLGYRPNVTIALWRSDIDLATALQAIRTALGVPESPTTDKGDCVIACDGTYQTPQATAEVATEPPAEPAPPPVAPLEQPESALQATGAITGAPQREATNRTTKKKRVVKKRVVKKRVTVRAGKGR